MSQPKILINPLKRFHDWKRKFFFIREEMLPIAMIFRPSGEIEKEDTPIPKKEAWYDNLMPTPNKVFGEQVLIAAGMSDKWPERSKEVPVLLLDGEEQALYQSAFKTFAGTMGVRPIRDREEYWYEQIKPLFIYAPTELLVNPPVATEDPYNLPKSFHDWKRKFFFIREEMLPITMIFLPSGEIEKEDTPIPKKDTWYDNLMPTPNRVFGEQVLVAAGMNDKWPERSKEVPVLLLDGEEQALYHSSFKNFAGTMGVRPLRDGEEYWYEQIKPSFIYAPAELFVNLPVTT
ncbi:hypothetical protein Hanom_Chr13g01183081 [Helianthus anomalus]